MMIFLRLWYSDPQQSKWKYLSYFEMSLKKQHHSLHTPYMLNGGSYDLTTKARRAVMGRHKQLDGGAGRQIWKCLDPLNCVAMAVFWKLGTWVQTWTWIFWGRTVPSWTLNLGHTRDCLAWSVSSQVSMVITSVSLISVSLISISLSRLHKLKGKT